MEPRENVSKKEKIYNSDQFSKWSFEGVFTASKKQTDDHESIIKFSPVQ